MHYFNKMGVFYDIKMNIVALTILYRSTSLKSFVKCSQRNGGRDMKAILLAAGRGTRISRMVQAVPKSTLPIDGVPLIRGTVEKLQKTGISTVICVGYEQKKVRKALCGLDCTYYYNPFYDVTNSIASLWFARDVLDEDVLILNADVYFTDNVLERILADRRENVVAIDKTRVAVGDYFFSTTDNGCIVKYGKDLPLQERNCEYVGIAKLKKEFLPHFKQRLEELIAQQKHQLWWENVLYSFAGNQERNIYTVDVEGNFWAEIDYFDDYERILNYVEKHKMHLQIFERTEGAI